MTFPERYDLTIEQGATLKRWYALRYPDGTLVDLEDAGYDTARLTVRDQYSGDAILELTTDNGGISVTQEADANGTTWTGYFYASATATASLEDFGDGVFTMEISDGLDVIRVMEGIAVLSPETTT